MSTQSKAIGPVLGDQVSLGKRNFKPGIVVPVSLIVGLVLGAMGAILFMGTPSVGTAPMQGADSQVSGRVVSRSQASSLAENPELTWAHRSAAAGIRAQANDSAYLAGNPELVWARRVANVDSLVQSSESAYLAANPELSWHRRADSSSTWAECAAYLAENPELSLTRRTARDRATWICR